MIGQLKAQKQPEIDKSRFAISATSASFTAEGGSKSFSVTADKEWSIKTKPASWATLTKIGQKLTLKVGANTSSEQRKTSFVITSIGKTIKVTVSQSAASLFEISAKNATFGSSGGSKSFKVSCNSSWGVDVSTASWGHIEKNGNTLTLRVDPNQSNSKRTDYFILKSGSKSLRVDISQAGKTLMSGSSRQEQARQEQARQEQARQEQARQEQARFEISSTSALFNSSGGTQTFTVTSSGTWQILTNTAIWGHLTRSGNTLTLKVDQNMRATDRTDFFVITSGEKTIRVNISQKAGDETLSVNGSLSDVSVGFGGYGGTKVIIVKTNVGEYQTLYLPPWCYIKGKTSSEFILGCYSNPSGNDRRDWMTVKAGKKSIRINISQNANYSKRRRLYNGGWVNMPIGFEGGYNVSGEDLWYANGIVGVRIGNYTDVVQLELGATPGVISSSADKPVFHLPLYGTLKLSVKSGKFYFKFGGAYNVIRAKVYEGDYSLRAGFGSAWKHFDWDWVYVQLNAPVKEWDYNTNIFNTDNMFVGMRWTWYITR
jgi:hypothetical protein